MIVWVKSTGQYSVEMINILPTGVQAFAIVVGVVVPSFAMWVIPLRTRKLPHADKPLT